MVASHRQIIVQSFRKERLEYAQLSILEPRRSTAQEQAPHADESVIKHPAHLLNIAFEIVRPPVQSSGVMQTQILHIEEREPSHTHCPRDLIGSRQVVARENVFPHPRIAG